MVDQEGGLRGLVWAPARKAEAARRADFRSMVARGIDGIFLEERLEAALLDRCTEK